MVMNMIKNDRVIATKQWFSGVLGFSQAKNDTKQRRPEGGLGAPDSGLGGGMGATEAGARVSLRGEGEERLKIGGQEQSWCVCV